MIGDHIPYFRVSIGSWVCLGVTLYLKGGTEYRISKNKGPIMDKLKERNHTVLYFIEESRKH